VAAVDRTPVPSPAVLMQCSASAGSMRGRPQDLPPESTSVHRCDSLRRIEAEVACAHEVTQHLRCIGGAEGSRSGAGAAARVPAGDEAEAQHHEHAGRSAAALQVCALLCIAR
jgi:hypothetical protein